MWNFINEMPGLTAPYTCPRLDQCSNRLFYPVLPILLAGFLGFGVSPYGLDVTPIPVNAIVLVLPIILAVPRFDRLTP